MALFQFTYPITRPYPYSWFKWVVLFGGIILLVLLSILNVASTGYELVVQHSVNPNETTSSEIWTEKLPISLNAKTTASCEPQNIQATGQYFTNKFGLIYTISSVWQSDSTGKNTTLPSLQYLNNPLEDCNVNLITLDFDQWDDRTASEIGWTPWGMRATGYLSCLIDNGAQTRVNLSTQYQFNVPTIETGVPFQFVHTPTEQNETSLYWGQSLMSWYWMDVVHAMANASIPDLIYEITKGSITLQPSKNVSDMTSLDFFSAPNYHFVSQFYNPRSLSIQSPTCCINAGYLPGASIGELHAYSSKEVQTDESTVVRLPDIWISADSFAKVFMSTMLADVGQNSSLTALNNAAALHHFSKNITKMAGNGYDPFSKLYGAPLNGHVENWLKAGPARKPYEEADGGNLNILPSMLYNQYTCQVPRLKSIGSLIFAVLVADLVFLQAAWVILNWITVHVMQSKEPTAHHCMGCMGEVLEDAGGVSTPMSKMARSYQPVPVQ